MKTFSITARMVWSSIKANDEEEAVEIWQRKVEELIGPYDEWEDCYVEWENEDHPIELRERGELKECKPKKPAAESCSITCWPRRG